MTTIEVCIDSASAAVDALKAHIDSLKATSNATGRSQILRLEVCSALHQGGLTPSPGLVKAVGRAVKATLNDHLAVDGASMQVEVQLFLMIRCRAGNDFVYNEWEMQTMIDDIDELQELAKRESVVGDILEGFVFGALTAEGRVQETQLAEAASMVLAANRWRPVPFSFTFHRAIDEVQCPQPEAVAAIAKVLQQFVETGKSSPWRCYILTSGGKATCSEATSVIRTMEDTAKASSTNGIQLQIMPGGGVGPSNAAYILKETACKLLHLSSKTVLSAPSRTTPANNHGPAAAGDFYWSLNGSSLRTVMDDVAQLGQRSRL